MALTLIFQMADETYGLDIGLIHEVVEDLPIHYVPFQSEILLGAVNFHGEVLPVLDLPLLLGFGDGERDHRLIVVRDGEHVVAFTVSRVGRIVALTAEDIQPAPGERQQNAVRDVADVNGMMVNLLNTDYVIERLSQVVVQ